MKMWFIASLTRRIMGLIAISLVVSSWILGKSAETLHHETIFHQVRKQSLVFLYGLEREIRGQKHHVDPVFLQKLLERGMNHRKETFDFSIVQLKIFDNKGNSIAEVHYGDHVPSMHPPSLKRMTFDTYHGRMSQRVFSGFHAFVGGKIQHHIDPQTGKQRSEIQLTIPLYLNGNTPLALEAKLDMKETMAMIQTADEQYELHFVLIIGSFMVGTLLVIWMVIHRGLLKPIHDLCHTTNRIAKGELSNRVHYLVHDELGTLGQAINDMAASIEKLIQDKETAYLEAMNSLTNALEAKDTYTKQHSSRVAKYSVAMGKCLGLSAKTLEMLKKGALMHDLGKIGVPDAILNKPGALSHAEFQLLKQHPVNTAAIMRPLKRCKEFMEIAAWHHERWDGKGYPDGLSGDNIPLLARIVAIADTWDAMTGDRVYRKGMPERKVLSILKQERDTGQWDPHLIDVFVNMMQHDANGIHETSIHCLTENFKTVT